MRVAIVIPARFASSRLPRKALLRVTGKYLVQHVYERATQARCAGRVIVATDDRRIEAAVRSFGGEAVMTRRDHPSGTDRVAEVARSLEGYDAVVNVQGDEPLVDPAAIDRLPALLAADPDAAVATLAVPVRSGEVYRNPNCVKVVRSNGGRAMYFSRAPIPAVRDGEPDFARADAPFLHHLGLYAYRRDALQRLAALAPDPLEECEKLEQLRWLAAGVVIQVGTVAGAAGGVDTRADYDRFVALYRAERRLRGSPRRAA